MLCVYARRDPLRIVSRRDVIIVYMNSSSLMLRYVYISLHNLDEILYIKTSQILCIKGKERLVEITYIIL